MLSSRGVTQHTKHSELLIQTAANVRLSDPQAVSSLPVTSRAECNDDSSYWLWLCMPKGLYLAN